ncbi:hypothetical protein CVU37_14480 [candidate division BRC1 bacterium HGW-BRC1-1]|jgi:PAS domain S-box-containing protein|nr:MAG: hypothetical protein CVU37_14480 [candidate division BRC1 bacterium HGW-BRC1-1]
MVSPDICNQTEERLSFLRTLGSAFAVMALMIAGLSASLPTSVCAQGVTPGTTNTMESGKTTPTLVVVGDLDYPPFTFLDHGRPTGFDIELMRALGDVMQTTVQIELLPWTQARDRLIRGEADLIAGMARSQQREANLVFSRPTSLISMALFCRENSSIRSADDPAVRRVGVQRGGIMHDMMMGSRVLPEIVARESTTEILQLLSDGIIDCAFLNGSLVDYHRRQMHIDNVRAINVVQTRDYCIAALRGREGLIGEVNAALDEVHKSGLYDALHDHWLGAGVSPNAPKQNQPLLSRYPWPFWLAVTAAALLAVVLGLTVRRARRHQLALDVCAKERIATEDELQARARHARAVMMSLKDGLILLRADGAVEKVNPALCSMTGFSEDEILGATPPWFFVAPDAQPAVETMWSEMKQQRFGETETLLLNKRGGRVPVLLSPAIIRGNDDMGEGWSIGVKDIARRTETEKALRLSEERFRLFAGAIDQALWLVDPTQGQILYISPACEQIWGFPQEQFYRFPDLWLDIIHPDDRELVTRNYRDWLGGKTLDFREEYRVMRSDGTVRWLLDHGVAAPVSDGEDRFVVGLTKDVTDRRQTERELADSRERLALMSTSAETLLGDKSPQQIGNELVKLVCLVFAVDACVIRTVEDDSLRFLACYGVSEKMLAPDIPKDWGISGRILGPRKPLAIADAGIAGDLPQPGTPPPHTYAFISYAGAPMLAGDDVVGIIGIYSERVRREFSKQDLSDLQIIANQIAAVVLNDRLFKEVKSRRDDLEQEVAERVRLEERIVQGQKLESLGLLAGGVAHDFNNLLVGILGNAALITEELDDESPLSAPVSEINQSARLASDVCRQLLSYAGKGKSSSHLVDLNELAGEMAQIMSGTVAGKATLEVIASERAITVETDPVQMRQAVMNLITNATESFTCEGGWIKISTGVVACNRAMLARAYVDAGPGEGDYGYVEVSDNGDGMTSETMQRVFDPFFSTKKRGSGLGLAVVLGMVRSHHGVLMVKSRPGEGTSFRILFPAITEEESDGPAQKTEGEATEKQVAVGETTAAASAPGSRHKAENLVGHGTIVVVDDEASVRSVAVRILARHGFHTVEARDGEEALALLHEHAETVRCILLDLTMPKLDGEQTLKVVREKTPDLPVIISSGHAADDVFARCQGLGATAYLQKPYSASAMVGVLSQVLGPGLSG